MCVLCLFLPFQREMAHFDALMHDARRRRSRGSDDDEQQSEEDTLAPATTRNGSAARQVRAVRCASVHMCCAFDGSFAAQPQASAIARTRMVCTAPPLAFVCSSAPHALRPTRCVVVAGRRRRREQRGRESEGRRRMRGWQERGHFWGAVRSTCVQYVCYANDRAERSIGAAATNGLLSVLSTCTCRLISVSFSCLLAAPAKKRGREAPPCSFEDDGGDDEATARTGRPAKRRRQGQHYAAGAASTAVAFRKPPPD